FDKAYGFSKKAYGIAKEIGNVKLQMETSDILAQSSVALGLYKEAYNYHVEFKEMADSLQNDSNIKEITNLQNQYDFENEKRAIEQEQQKKDAINAEKARRQKTVRNAFVIGFVLVLLLAIAILRSFFQKRKANNKLVEQNAIISKQKEEREILLKEIHHRVKNNLQIISSLLNLQTKNIEDKSMLSAMEDGQNRVKAMALIHQRLYQNDDISQIDFKEYTAQLLNQIAGLYPGLSKVERKVSIGNVNLDIDTAIPIGLILSELITNGYKYAFENDKGLIEISLEQKGHDYILKVRDNGPGLPKDFDLSKTPSIGLRLVRRLSQQLYGNAVYEYIDGSVFIVTFKDTLGRKNIA
ncbi:MAG: hypothetical protein GXO89_01790, partial [Chlorobi bacterium]|nr:hypothetical protein [Chlorobiota bacterium]